MKFIPNMFYAPYLNTESMETTVADSNWKRIGATVDLIRKSPCFPIHSYGKLLEEIGLLGNSNGHYKLFFMPSAYELKNKNNQTDIFSSICLPDIDGSSMPKRNIKDSIISNRWNNLKAVVEKFRDKFDYNWTESNDKPVMMLLEHYKLFKTPYFEVTESLHCAASLALHKRNKGFLYVFALPFPTGRATYSEENEMMLYRMSSIAPANATSLLFSDMYMVAPSVFNLGLTDSNNLAGRLIAKYELFNESEVFWKDSFNPFPDPFLSIELDPYFTTLSSIDYQDVVMKGSDPIFL